METEDIIDAFRSAYDEVAELETFPLQEYIIEAKETFGNLIMYVKENGIPFFKISIYNFKSKKRFLDLQIHRNSRIEINGFFVTFLRDVFTEFNSQKLSYEGLRSVFLLLLMEIINMQSGETSEIIRTMAIRLYNLYEYGVSLELKSFFFDNNRIGIINAAKNIYQEEFILRPVGWEITTEEASDWLRSLKHREFVFRGMTSEEYNNTVEKGLPIQSIGKYSFESEGTSFAESAEDSESYVNFGIDDPRKTLKSNYLVEVAKTSNMIRDKDGYYKSKEPVEYEEVGRIWEMYSKNGEIVAKRIPGPNEHARYQMTYVTKKGSIIEQIYNDIIILTNEKVSPSSLKEYETFDPVI